MKISDVPVDEKPTSAASVPNGAATPTAGSNASSSTAM